MPNSIVKYVSPKHLASIMLLWIICFYNMETKSDLASLDHYFAFCLHLVNAYIYKYITFCIINYITAPCSKHLQWPLLLIHTTKRWMWPLCHFLRQFPIHHCVSTCCSVMQLVYELLATLNETADWINFIIPLLSIDYVSDAWDINSSVGGHFID